MMKQVLIFHTGETTCSEKPSYPGSMCPFVYTRNFGTQPVCHLYGDVPLDDVDGWLQAIEWSGGVIEHGVIPGL
jgi:hypothetical protein